MKKIMLFMIGLLCLSMFPLTALAEENDDAEKENVRVFSNQTIDIDEIEAKTYTGRACKQDDLDVWDNEDAEELFEGVDYTVSYKNNVDVGTATITLTGKGVYSGSISKTFKINPKKVKPVVKLSNTQYTYRGKVIKPTVTVKTGSKVLNQSDYTVSFSKGLKKVGIYKAEVNLKGNYSGSKTVKFIIAPKGTKVTKLAAGAGQINVKWKKQTNQTSGYQIQYSQSSKFKSGAKKVTVKGVKKTSATLKKLKGGKKYYVRVRTFKKVSGKTIYSDWSKAKKVKTKKVPSKRSSDSARRQSGESSDSGSDDSGSGTVYWTPSGKVYHYSKNCPTLSRSRNIYSGSISESGKPRGCKVCG